MKIALFLILMTAPLVWAEETANGACKDGKDEYCMTCVSDKCTVCGGSYEDEGQCKAPTTEVENCLYYSSATACQTCDMGYSGSSCAEISIENCYGLNPLDTTKCAMCKGVTDEADLTKCSGDACTLSNCLSCKGTGDDQTCQACEAGYTKAENEKSCTKDADPAEGKEGCANSGCSSCSYGYYVSNASGATAACTKSTRYGSVTLMGSAIAWLTFMLF